MKYTVKEYGNTGLHILLSKKFYKKGDVINIPLPEEKDKLTENRVREIAQEEIEKVRSY